MQSPELYERKLIRDKEFPVQLQINATQDKGCYFKAHWHEHLELHYVLEGNPVIRLNQRDIHTSPGNLVIANSDVIHCGYCDGSPIRVLVLIFEMESFSREFAGQNIVFTPLIEKDAKIDDIMGAIYHESEKRQLGWQLNCKGEIYRLITHLAREYAQEMLSERESDKRRRRLERLNTVLDYIRTNYKRPISNAELAGVVYLSESHFNHLFRESMGVPPVQYINEMRLKRAMQMLREEEMGIMQIAEYVGFTDYNHFCRQFRRYYGCTPSEVRRRESETGVASQSLHQARGG